MTDLLAIEDLPRGFDYPASFVRVVELGLTNLEPWWIITGALLQDRQRGLEIRYPARNLVVFAIRQDRDDVACWDLDEGGVAIIHDFASSGFEQLDRMSGFHDWLLRAVEDLIEFGD